MKGQNLEPKPVGDAGSQISLPHLVFTFQNSNYSLRLPELIRLWLPEKPESSKGFFPANKLSPRTVLKAHLFILCRHPSSSE